MADKTPVKATYSGSNVVGLAEYLTGETVPVANGGTGTTNAVAVISFGGDKTSTNGDFVIQFPTADASNAIVRIA